MTNIVNYDDVVMCSYADVVHDMFNQHAKKHWVFRDYGGRCTIPEELERICSWQSIFSRKKIEVDTKMLNDYRKEMISEKRFKNKTPITKRYDNNYKNL